MTWTNLVCNHNTNYFPGLPEQYDLQAIKPIEMYIFTKMGFYFFSPFDWLWKSLINIEEFIKTMRLPKTLRPGKFKLT
jgi:hypothetical protein